MQFLDAIKDYVEKHTHELIGLLTQLAKIPAPSNHEELRAAFCKDWLQAQGAEGVYIDEALNVVFPMDCEGDRPIAVFMAHSDVVFPDMEELPLRVEDGKIFCPGVGDDTANVAALLMSVKFILENNLHPQDMGVLFVINSGEEGLGNLKGVRKIVEDFGNRMAEFFTFDAFNCHGVDRAVGSRRFLIEASTQGGHSYNDFGRKNAIAVLAQMITKLYAIPLPQKGKTTFNVGTIEGGTSVNTIAQKAQMLFEFRSDELSSLLQMQAAFDAVLQDCKSEDAKITCTLVGDRPCAGDVDEEKMAQLKARAQDANIRHFGQGIVYSSGSTDCNIPLFHGVPSLCVGCCFGAGAHTREEYVELFSLPKGLAFCMELVLTHF